MERLVGPISDPDKGSGTGEAVSHPCVHLKRHPSGFLLINKLVTTHKVRVLAAVLLLFLLLIYGGLSSFDLRLNTDYTEIIDNYEVIALQAETMEPGTVYCQPFTAADNELESIQIQFYDLETESSTNTFEVSITDGADHTLYQQTVSRSELAPIDNEVTVGISIPSSPVSLKKGETYYINLSLSEGETSSWLAAAVLPNFFINHFSGEFMLETAGVPTNASIYVHYSRFDHSVNFGFWLILLYIGFLAALFWPRESRILKALHIAAVFALPLFVFYEWEILTGNYLDIETVYMGYSVLLLYCVLFIFISLFGLQKGAVSFAVVGNIFGAANYFVMQFRGSQISVSDFYAIRTAATVAGNYHYSIPVHYAALCMGTLIFLILLCRVNPARDLRKHMSEKLSGILPGGKYGFWAGNLTCHILSACAWSFILSFVFLSLPTEAYYAWNPGSNYSTMGWLYTTCMQMREGIMTEPEGYDEETAKNLLKQSDGQLDLGNEKPDKLIVIMNESFSDLSVLSGFETNMDYMPYIHSLEENTEKGWLSVPVLGGGTCNTEWEVLSGNSKVLTGSTFSPYSSYYSAHGKQYNTASLVSAAEAEGYYAVASHPYGASNWNRSTVYPLMGFQEFLSYDYFADCPTIRDYVSDAGNFQRLIEYAEDKDDQPIFIFNVTMQNHSGYLDFDTEDIVIKTEGFDSKEVNSYLTLIYESDQAFGELVEYYKQADEKVMIVMFGDHQPSLSDEFYQYLYGMSETDERTEEQSYLTPYIIWSNYERNTGNVALMSANFFGAYIKQAAGWELDDYDCFRLSFMQMIPSVGQFGVFDANGQYTLYSEMTEEQNDLLDTLRYVQYYYMNSSS